MDFAKTLETFGQEHVLHFYEELSQEEKRSLKAEVEALDFAMIEEALHPEEAGGEDTITPYPTLKIPQIRENKEEYLPLGLEELRKGGVAAVILAGGQGTRLGFNGPKGTLNVGITKELYLFECLIRNIQANLQEGFPPMPVYIMTSEDNHEDTVAFFEKHDYFGYPKEAVHFFKQSMAPGLSLDGKILMKDKGHILLAPNGNGGWFRSLQQQGLIDQMKVSGVRYLNVVSVDNVLQNIGDPVFIGAAIKGGYSAAGKVIAKVTPLERVGAVCRRNGKPSVVEYSELSDAMRNAVDEKGNYLYHYGVTLNYLFEIEPTEAKARESLPIHRALKKMSFMDKNGQMVHPEEPNAYKLEYFIFDILQFFDEFLSFEVVREDEFAPIKNASGVDSLETARELLAKKTGMDL